MKRISALSFFIIVLFTLQTSAQTSIMGDINYPTLEKYIALAKQNYTKIKITGAQAASTKTGIAIAQVSYLDIFQASYYYRPNDQPVVNGTNPYTVNGWQFSLNFNLGLFLQKPFMVKKAKADYRVAQLQNEDMMLTTESEVKRRYFAYLQAISQLKIKTQGAQDSKSISETSRHKFERGELSLDLYNASRMMVSSAAADQIQSEVNYLNAKDALEEIIGQKLSDVK
ncbi:Outer membrane efflux protein [Pedobacter westerhofensis]|uniref:Outer membrane efflux protein n=1 Tax=Pedobacter westerhofensis TaxID=425512 RepID=A0A521E6G2_9SPHI|nr:TolC family protein [Pedobacter westerhofensis]SMO79475.1 Outer membrane efflux protein [Pedobacter westerhofensis]